MKRTLLLLLLLLLLLAATASAQNRYWLTGGGTYPPDAEVELQAWLEGNPPTDLILSRVLNPDRFLQLGGPGTFEVTPGLELQEIMTREVTGAGDAGIPVSFGQLEPGMYLAQLGPEELAAATLVLVTELGLVTKRDGDSLLIYAAELDTGQPVPVQLFLGAGADVKELRGDESGVTVLSSEELPEGDAGLAVGARAGDSWAFNDTWWSGWAGNVPAHYLVTDRPVYEPGDTVSIKGTVRLARTLEAVSGQDVTIEVRDTDYEPVLETVAETDAYGSFSIEVEIPAGAAEGPWSVSTSLADSSGWLSFRVEEYRKPEYVVDVERHEEYAIQDAETRFTVSAEYLSGGSPGGADVSWVVLSEPYSPWTWRSEYGFYTETSGVYGGDVIARGDGTLGEDGSLDIPVTLARRDEDYRLTLQASVRDESGREQTAQASMIAYRADLVLGVDTGGYAHPVGDAVPVTVTARDLEGNPVSTDFELATERRYWVEGVGATSEIGPTYTGTTDAAGEAVLEIAPEQAGSWVFTAGAHDAENRFTDNSTSVWLYGGDAWYWDYRNLEITADQEEYEPGDTARFVIESPVADGWALVTSEGSGIREYEVIRFEGNAFTVELEVTDTDLPNSWLGIAVAGGGEVYSAQQSYRVNPGSRFLDVQAEFPDNTFEPGAETEVTVTVRDADGEPVTAQLTLALVDEAVFLIRPDQTQDIRAFFYEWRGNNVTSSLSTFTYFGQVAPAAAARAPMDEAAFGQAKSAAAEDAAATPDAEDARLREDFRDTILWLPDLETGPDGTATARVVFPDDLTRWRLTARALSEDGKAGQTTASVTTTLPVISRLVVPEYLVAGDVTRARVIGQNNLEREITARFALEATGLETEAVPDRTEEPIGPGGRATADWWLAARDEGTAEITGSVSSSAAGDAMKLPLEITARAVPDELVWAGTTADAWSFSLPAGAVTGTAAGSVQLTTDLGSAAAPAAGWLSAQPDAYPELAISRLLAAIWADDSDQEDEAAWADLETYVRTGLAALYRQQHPDGGWGFGRFDVSDPAVSARVTAGLLEIAAAGFTVREWELGRALDYLEAAGKKDEYAVHERLKPEISAVLAADARAEIWRTLNLAGRDTSFLAGVPGDPALSNAGLAVSVLAELEAGNETEARLYLDELAGRIERRDAVAWLEAARTPVGVAGTSRTAATALTLEALARLQPGSDLIPLLGNWLLLERQGSHWYSARDNVAVLAAARTLPRSEADSRVVTVLLNGEEVAEVEVGSESVTVPLAGLFTEGGNELSFGIATDAPVFAAATVTFMDGSGLSEPVNDGISVTREYALLEPEWLEDEGRFTYRQVPADSFREGDYLVASVTLDGSGPLRFVEVTEPLPAGFTVVEDDRSFRLADVPARYGPDYPGWNWWYDARSIGRREVSYLFALVDGPLTFTYILQAEQPGTFTALPSRARLVRERDVTGRSAAQVLKVTE